MASAAARAIQPSRVVGRSSMCGEFLKTTGGNSRPWYAILLGRNRYFTDARMPSGHGFPACGGCRPADAYHFGVSVGQRASASAGALARPTSVPPTRERAKLGPASSARKDLLANEHDLRSNPVRLSAIPCRLSMPASPPWPPAPDSDLQATGLPRLSSFGGDPPSRPVQRPHHHDHRQRRQHGVYDALIKDYLGKIDRAHASASDSGGPPGSRVMEKGRGIEHDWCHSPLSARRLARKESTEISGLSAR